MKLVYHPEASDELHEAVKFYQKRRTGLGQRFFENVISTLETIPHFSEVGRMDQDGYRVFRVLGFPYKPYYDCILVIAVAHQRRKHGYWLGRWFTFLSRFRIGPRLQLSARLKDYSNNYFEKIIPNWAKLC